MEIIMKDKYYMIVHAEDIVGDNWWAEAPVFVDEKDTDKVVINYVNNCEIAGDIILMEVKPISKINTKVVNKVEIKKKGL